MASPSMVVTVEPSACTANTVHDLTLRPSMSTVHAPHWLVSQPTWVPVRIELLAQEAEQQARLDVRLARLAVDRDGDLDHVLSFRVSPIA